VKKPHNDKNNPDRMWVDHKYIPSDHPQHTPGRFESWDAVPKEPNKQGDTPSEPEKGAGSPKYEGLTWDSPLDSKMAGLKPVTNLPKRGRKSSSERFAEFNTTKDNAPTFRARDLQPGILYMIRPCPWTPWWIKVGMIGADDLDSRLRSDYEKGIPPGPEREAMDFDILGYMPLWVASGERHLIQELRRYATRDRNEFFLFAPEQVPMIDGLVARIIFKDVGAKFYDFEKGVHHARD